MNPDALAPAPPTPWACGDFAVIGATFVITAEQLAEAADLRAGERVLDVGTGSGNAALAAARRFARVSACDIVPALLDRTRERARAEGLALDARLGDAHALPWADASFDVVLSNFGAMYAADAARTAQELLRVLRPGGRIALASWTPDGVVGRLEGVVDAQLRLEHGAGAGTRHGTVARWGTRARLAALFGAPHAVQLRARRRRFVFRYRSAAHWMQVFRDFHGPMHRAFARLGTPGRLALERTLTAVLDAANTAGPGALVVPADYLEAVITRPDTTPRAPSRAAS